jgi:hypothetical protein
MTRDSRVYDYRIQLSPPASLNCRENPRSFPRNPGKCPYFTIIPQQTGLQRADCSTAKGALSMLFSGGHMNSPVSRRAQGECNAIRSRGFGRSELTFVGTWKAIPVLPRSPFLDQGLRGSTTRTGCCNKPLARHIRSRRPCDNHQAFVIAEY